MNNIFKLIFEHDLRLDELSERNTELKKNETEAALADFMKPDPTYSKFYLSGTDLKNERFGLNVLSAYSKIIDAIEQAFPNKIRLTAAGHEGSLHQIIETLETGQVVVFTDVEAPDFDAASLHTDRDSNVGHRKPVLRESLDRDFIVIYKEPAKDGFDLHIFSKNNIYRDMFFPLQRLAPDNFRFFSINGKKLRSERQFYFETWTLERPPHGFEEVFPESVL